VSRRPAPEENREALVRVLDALGQVRKACRACRRGLGVERGAQLATRAPARV
jgi:hypothetical protein